MVKLSEFEAPPPGVALTTVTGFIPALAISEALMEAVNFVLLT